jgi:sec-independent protein translocase protein TatA
MNLLAFAMPGMMEMCIIGGVALLLFGSRLPTVARDVGRSFFELKKGMNEVIDCSDETS